jgi:DNA-binding NarL/FixJ family response regulator
VDEGAVALVADHLPLNRAGLSSLLIQDLHASAAFEASSFDGIVAALARNDEIGVIAAALELPGMNGTSGIRYIRSRHPKTKLVMMAGEPSRESVLECLTAGTHGYIPKAFGRDDMVAAFTAILAGQIYVPSMICDIAEAGVPPLVDGVIPAFDLTHRQREVLILMAEGKANKEIARILGISVGTVKAHVNTSFRILGVHNRTSAVLALRRLESARDPGQPSLPGLLDPRRRSTDELP